MRNIFSVFILSLMLAFVVSLGTANAFKQVNTDITVMELFTSQSCSSCPPADRLLNDLSKKPNTIALSCNVTYWDHLNWKDTLSKEFCTVRQKNYSVNLGRAGNVFTPELVINGKKSLVGSKKKEIVQQLDYIPNPAALKVKRTGSNLVISDALRQFNKSNTVLLVTYGNEVTQEIPSGENSGKEVSYTNPILSIIKLYEDWDGRDLVIDLEYPLKIEASGVAILVHEGHDMANPIIAAGQEKL